MNLQLNLATRVYVDFRKVNLLISLLFILAFSWCTYGIYTLILNYEESGTLAKYKAKSLGSTSAGKVSNADYNKLMANIKFANSILDKRRYDWLTMLDNLETVVPDGVSLKGLAPSEKGDLVKLTGSAKNFNAVRIFIENLEASTKFTEVFLTEQSYIKEGNINRGLSFSVTCRAVI